MTSEPNTSVRVRTPRRDIQGLRALAVALVVLNHADNAWAPGGYVGVDVFFVISGFLITGQLVRRLEQSGRIGFGSFYAARVRRLLPMSALVLLATLVAARFVVPPLLREELKTDAVATALFNSNNWFALQQTDYLANQSPSPFQHYWSLALEEQFYLVWPVTLLALWAVFRTRRRILAASLVLAAISFVLCVYLTDVRQPWAFFSLPTRAWELAIGGALALSGLRVPERWKTATLATGLAAIAASAFFFSHDTTFPGTAALVPTLGTALVIAAHVERSPLSWAPLQWVGDRSYSLYLWHWPVLVLPAVAWGEPRPGQQVGLVLIALALSWWSYRFVEQPARHARPLAGAKPAYAFLATVTACSVLVAAVVGATGELADTRKVAATAPETWGLNIPATPFVPANAVPRLADAADNAGESYSDGCHADVPVSRAETCFYGTGKALTVAVFGDSHAAQWTPGIKNAALARGGRVLSLTKSSCPSVDLSVYSTMLKRMYTECDAWRADALDLLNDVEPDVVFISNYGVNHIANTSGTTTQDWAQGLERTIRELPSRSKIVVIGDTPSWPENVNECLSRHLDAATECALPASRLLSSDVRAQEMRFANDSGGPSLFVDSAQWLCSERCFGVLGNFIVYRDSNHITANFSEALGEVLFRRAGL